MDSGTARCVNTRRLLTPLVRLHRTGSFVKHTAARTPCITWEGNPKRYQDAAARSPVHLAYPRGVCIYCGRHGWTKDHLFPRNWTGNIRRNFTALEFDPPLRQYVVDGMEKRAEVERMLSWPEDPTFDERALERSGIEDPYILGLILSPDVAHPTQAEEAS